MMGRQAAPAQLFYDFRLEDHIPPQHLLRQLDQILRFDSIRLALASYYSHTGRPSIDPELMLRMMLVGYAFGIRSDRRLCEEVHLNLAYRWFCRLGLDGRVPDHSTFSKNRYGRFQESGIYRTLFEEVVSQCQAAGLVGGEGFAVDGTLIAANANFASQVATVEELREKAQSSSVSRPIRDYLAALDAEIEGGGPAPFRPAQLSVTDPQAAWCQKNKQARFGYYSNYLIDTEHAIIVGVEATPARPSQEVAAARTMLERAAKRHGLAPRRLAADKLYGSGPFLSWLVDRKVEPHIPLIDRRDQDSGVLPGSAFTYEAARDAFTCPEGKTIGLRAVTVKRRVYKANAEDCLPCKRRADCTKGNTTRVLSRHTNEDAREQVRALARTEAYARSRRERKKVEMLFAHLKQQFRFRHLKLRGLSGATEEFLLAATVQNLRRLIRLRPPDASTTCLPAAA